MKKPGKPKKHNKRQGGAKCHLSPDQGRKLAKFMAEKHNSKSENEN